MSYTIEKVTKVNAAELDAFVRTSSKAHFTQLSSWSKVKSEWNWCGLLCRNEGGEIVGAMALLIRKVPVLPYKLLYSPRGPVCDVNDAQVVKALIKGAQDVAKSERGYLIKVDTDVSIEDEQFAETMREIGFDIKNKAKNFEGIQPRFVFRLNVEGKTEEELLASFHSKTRYNIRVAEKNNVQVRICGKEQVEDFHKIMVETGERDDFTIRSSGYFAKMLDAFGNDARLYMAYYEDKPIAGTIAIHCGDKVWYLYGASSNAYRNVMPNYLLQWEMIKWSVQLGCRIYDFRGVSGDLDPQNPLYGLYRFKKGFNGDFVEFIGEMDLVQDAFGKKLVDVCEKAYRWLRRTKKKLMRKK